MGSMNTTYVRALFSNMGQHTSIMQLPAQSGKTRRATELMNKWNQILETDGSMGHHHLNLIFTSNSKLLSRQTARRVQREVHGAGGGEEYEESSSDSDDESESDANFNGIVYDIPSPTSNKTFPWISGGRKPMNERDVYFSIRKEGVENIICCTNKARIRRVITLMNYLCDDRHCFDMEGRTVNIWIDEADACMKLWRRHIRDIVRWGDFVNKVVLISATMGPVIQYFHKEGIDCNLRVFQNTHADVYVKFSECEVHHEHSDDASQTAIDHLISVLDHVAIPANSRWFCPGSVARKSHEEVAMELLRRGFNVLILNGKQKHLLFCDGSTPIPVMDEMGEDNLELSTAIRKLYYEHSLNEQPFAVTGNLCVSRGITFASKEGDQEFLFTHGVIPDIGSAEEIYQMVSRCLGNFRDYRTFVPPKLYMNRIVSSKICNQEHLAVELARRYFRPDIGETTHLSSQDYASISQEHRLHAKESRRVKKDASDRQHCLFNTQEEAIRFAKETLHVSLRKRDASEYKSPGTLLQRDGTNPTLEYVLKRFWGIGNGPGKSAVRMVLTDQDKWCVYWAPSLISKS